jgi:tRNA threonylcarbamoyladenosine biosynthesis protein TsaE
MTVEIICSGTAETAAFAARLARDLRAGNIILFEGPLGVGKTFLVKSLSHALGSTDLVTSPTFAIANFYSAPACRIIHIDAYRIKNVGEYNDLGLDDYFQTSIVLVEWGNLLADRYPEALIVRLEFTDRAENERKLVISSGNKSWTPLLDALSHCGGAQPS